MDEKSKPTYGDSLENLTTILDELVAEFNKKVFLGRQEDVKEIEHGCETDCKCRGRKDHE